MRLAGAARCLHNVIFPFALRKGTPVPIVKLYFLLGLAMLLVVMWDYNKFPATARRFTRAPPGTGSQFSLIALNIRNLTVMALVAFFLWPLVILMELSGRQQK